MLRREHHERRAVDRVRTRREELDRRVGMALDRETEARALRTADPVPLRGHDRFGPLDAVEPEQLVGVRGDLEEPLREVLLHHRCPAALAAAVDDLLVREHRLVLRAPVRGRGGAVGEALLEELQEDPLVPLVVLGLAGDDLARPVEHRPHRAHLAAHVRDVVHRPRARMDPALDGGVLGRQPERVEAHREQHVVPAHSLVARARVGRRHHVPVTDVEVARRIRVHRQEVVVLLVGDVGRAVETLVFPGLLPLRFDRLRFVSLRHRVLHKNKTPSSLEGDEGARPPRYHPD